MKFYVLVDKNDDTNVHYNAHGWAIYTNLSRAKKHLREDANIAYRNGNYVVTDRYEIREFDTSTGLPIEDE